MYRLINIIIYSNNHRQRVTSHNLEMSRDGVGFTPRDVWNWGLKNSVMVRPVPIDRLRFALLPEDEATVRAEGYFFEAFTIAVMKLFECSGWIRRKISDVSKSESGT